MNDSRPSPAYYLGIDLGGTNIKSGVVDDEGHPLSHVSMPTQADHGGEAGIASLAEAGRRAVEASGVGWEGIAAVGLGSPGTMDIDAGMLLEPPNLPGWENLPVRALLEAKLAKPTVLQNDGNAAAFGEYWVGAGHGARSMVMLTLGTGVGCGIVIDGSILQGRHSHGGECGHIVVQMENGRRCSCGKMGHLEGYASATAVAKRALEALEADDAPSTLRTIDPAALDSRAVFMAAQAGDAIGERIREETAYYLAVGAICLMNTIDPDIVLFGGGMIAAGSPFLTAIQRHVKELAFPVPAARTRIEFALLGGDAGFIGAAGWARAVHGPGKG